MLLKLMSQTQSGWPFVASIIYTAAWSISFYGQTYENYKHKSVQGCQMDFIIYNIVGYTFYGIYSTLGFFFKDKGAGTVVIGDLVFIYHGIVMVAIWAIQAYIYPWGKNRLSLTSVIICILFWLFIGFQIIFTHFFHVLPDTLYFNPVSSMGYANLIITLIKYTPQVYWNYKRKSTEGWSIFNMVLDLVGATFSFASSSLSLSNGLNIAKFILAIISVCYDCLFIFQHYCLYNKNHRKQPQQYLQKLAEDAESTGEQSAKDEGKE